MASQQNSQSNAIAQSYGTLLHTGVVRGSGKTNVQQTMYQQILSATYLNPRDYEKLARNATYHFEVTKTGPVLTEAPLEELEKAWCLYKTLDGAWIAIYARRNNGRLKCFHQGNKNIPHQLKAQLMLLGIHL